MDANMSKHGIVKGVFAFLLGACVVSACVIGGYAVYEKRDVLAAQWHFSNGPFQLIAVDKQAEQVVVKLLASEEQANMDVITYRNCPYQDEAIWNYQSRENIALAYFIPKQALGNAPRLDKKADNVVNKVEVKEQAYTQVAITICDHDWSVSREVNVLSTMDQP